MILFVLLALCFLVSCANPSSSQPAKVLKQSEAYRPSGAAPDSLELVCVDYYDRQGAFDSAVVLQGADTIRFDTINDHYRNSDYCDTIRQGPTSCGKNSTYEGYTVRRFSPDSLVVQFCIQMYDIDTVQDSVLTIHGIQFHACELLGPLSFFSKSRLIVLGKWILLERNAGYFVSGRKMSETIDKYKLDVLLSSVSHAYEYDNGGSVTLVKAIVGTTETIEYRLVNTYWN